MAKQGEPIVCRAQVSKDCYHGNPEFTVYDPEGPGQSEDGTWNGRSVVCDACYIRLGTPPTAQLEGAIRQLRHEVGDEAE